MVSGKKIIRATIVIFFFLFSSFAVLHNEEVAVIILKVTF